MLEIGTSNIQVATADIVDSFVVDQESTVGVLDGAMSAENGVVRLDNGSGSSWCWVNCELELGLLAIVGGKSLKQ